MNLPPDRGRDQKEVNPWEEFPALNGSKEATSKSPGAASVAPATGAAQAAPTYSETENEYRDGARGSTSSVW